MGYTVSKQYKKLEDLYELAEHLETSNYNITGSFERGGIHSENQNRFRNGESFEMELNEAFEQMKKEPGTNYKVSLTYRENPKLNITSRIGFLPTFTLAAELNEFSNMEEFEEFLEVEEGWT